MVKFFLKKLQNFQTVMNFHSLEAKFSTVRPLNSSRWRCSTRLPAAATMRLT